MALSPHLKILELSGLRLDQPLTHCGELCANEISLASAARFHAVERAFQTAIDRRVDLVILHSEILTDGSTGGRAAWFLGRLLESSCNQGIPVLWVEHRHNAWMERYVPTPPNLVRVLPGEMHRIVTSAGPVQFLAGRSPDVHSPGEREAGLVMIGLHCGSGVQHDLDICDLVLREPVPTSDRVEDFVKAAGDVPALALANLHTLCTDRTHTREPLAVSPLGYTRVACGLGATLAPDRLAEHLTEEVDAAAGRYFAEHPQTQLLIVDLAIAGHGSAWSALWNSEYRESLQTELSRLSRHPGCRIRNIFPMADGVEATRACPFTQELNAIWAEATDRPAHAVRTLADLAPASVTLDDWASHERIPFDHPLANEVRQACLHLLRSAS